LEASGVCTSSSSRQDSGSGLFFSLLSAPDASRTSELLILARGDGGTTDMSGDVDVERVELVSLADADRQCAPPPLLIPFVFVTSTLGSAASCESSDADADVAVDVDCRPPNLLLVADPGSGSARSRERSDVGDDDSEDRLDRANLAKKPGAMIVRLVGGTAACSLATARVIEKFKGPRTVRTSDSEARRLLRLSRL
jgi:hypothetical protein